MQFKDNQPRQDNDNNNTDPQPPQPDWRRWLWPGLLLVFLVWMVMSSGNWIGGNLGGSAQEIPYSTVRNNAEERNIQSITFQGDNVRGVFSSAVMITLNNGEQAEVTRFMSEVPEGGAEILQDILRENSPDTTIISDPPQSSPLFDILLFYGPFILLIIFFIWMSRRAQGQMNGVFGFGRSQAREYNAEMSRVTFDDVAGQDPAKKELTEVVDFLRNPEKYISLGARVPRGVLLVGPPGTGKTLMARAVAGEADSAFYSIAASEFVEMFVGVGASRVRDLFRRAKDNAPSIVFIDEIDAVGRQRGAGLGGGNDEREQTLNQLLSELDGFEQEATVIVMAATNRPDVLDPALLRPGRFDRQVTVDLPDRKGRLDTLKIHTRSKPLANEVNLEDIASATVGFSGADIANLANEAALNAARYNRKKITQADFTSAFERIILGTERPPLSNPEERKVTAYHEAGHALVAILTPGADRVLKVTITPRGQALGITAFMPEDDRRNYSRRYLEATIHVALGGRIAEEIIFNEMTTGATNDLRRVTDIARRMVSQFGMSEAIGPLNFGENDQQPFLGYSISQGRNYSEETASRIDTEVRRIVETAYKQVKQLLVENRDKLDIIAEELLKNEVIERQELLTLLNIGENKPIDTPDEVLAEQVQEADLPDAVEEYDIPTPDDGNERDIKPDHNPIVSPPSPDNNNNEVYPDDRP